MSNLAPSLIIFQVSVKVSEWQVLIIAATLLTQGSLSTVPRLGERPMVIETLAAAYATVVVEDTNYYYGQQGGKACNSNDSVSFFAVVRVVRRWAVSHHVRVVQSKMVLGEEVDFGKSFVKNSV